MVFFTSLSVSTWMGSSFDVVYFATFLSEFRQSTNVKAELNFGFQRFHPIQTAALPFQGKLYLRMSYNFFIFLLRKLSNLHGPLWIASRDSSGSAIQWSKAYESCFALSLSIARKESEKRCCSLFWNLFHIHFFFWDVNIIKHCTWAQNPSHLPKQRASPFFDNEYAARCLLTNDALGNVDTAFYLLNLLPGQRFGALRIFACHHMSILLKKLGVDPCTFDSLLRTVFSKLWITFVISRQWEPVLYIVFLLFFTLGFSSYHNFSGDIEFLFIEACSELISLPPVFLCLRVHWLRTESFESFTNCEELNYLTFQSGQCLKIGFSSSLPSCSFVT